MLKTSALTILLSLVALKSLGQSIDPIVGAGCVEDCWRAAERVNNCPLSDSERCLCLNAQFQADAATCIAFHCPDNSARSIAIRRQICGATVPTNTRDITTRAVTRTSDPNTEPATAPPSPRPTGPSSSSTTSSSTSGAPSTTTSTTTSSQEPTTTQTLIGSNTSASATLPTETNNPPATTSPAGSGGNNAALRAHSGLAGATVLVGVLASLLVSL